jgi:hypothetical protein
MNCLADIAYAVARTAISGSKVRSDAKKAFSRLDLDALKDATCFECADNMQHAMAEIDRAGRYRVIGMQGEVVFLKPQRMGDGATYAVHEDELVLDEQVLQPNVVRKYRRELREKVFDLLAEQERALRALIDESVEAGWDYDEASRALMSAGSDWFDDFEG